MTDIKKKVQALDPNVTARNVEALAEKANHNIYEALAVISKRARQLSQELKAELNRKLEEFSVHSDVIEEVMENKEQIEVSRLYERLPHPTIIATHEFINGELYYRYTNEGTEEENHGF